MGQRE